MDSYFWYILANSYFQLDETRKASNCHIKAKKSINQLSILLTNKDHVKCFIENNQFNFIINNDLNKVESIPDSKEITKPTFCSNCGSPAGEAKFCSNCGNKLF